MLHSRFLITTLFWTDSKLDWDSDSWIEPNSPTLPQLPTETGLEGH